MLGRGFGLLFEVDAGLFGTWPPAPGAPVLPWLPDEGDMLAAGAGVARLPGAALVEPGMPGAVVLAGIAPCIDPIEPPLDAPPIGRGAIVFTGAIAPCIAIAGRALRATAVDRHTYEPLPLP